MGVFRLFTSLSKLVSVKIVRESVITELFDIAFNIKLIVKYHGLFVVKSRPDERLLRMIG